MVRVLSIAAFASVLVASSSVAARPFRVDEIPNGKVKSCLNCHLTLKGEHFTDFGSDVKFNGLVGGGLVQQQHVDWSLVAGMDSDHDTFPNGVELGDPQGTWQVGDPSPSTTVFNPGDPESHPTGTCGNGVVEPDEDCEPGLEPTSSCTLLGYDGGTVACAPGCTLDLAGCAGFEPDGGAPIGDGDEGSSGDGADEGGGCAMDAGGGAGAAGAAMASMFALGMLVARARRTQARTRTRLVTRPRR